jgi:signal transduction histidine kinase
MGSIIYKTILSFLLSFFLSCATILAQQTATPDTAAIASARTLSFQYITSNPNEAFSELQYTRQIADSTGNKEALADILANMSVAKSYLGDWDESVEYRMNSINLYEELNMLIQAGYGFAELGWSVRRRDMDRAEYFMQRGIQILKKFPQSEELSNAYNNYGIVKLNQSQIDSAIYYVNKSLDIKTQNKDTLGIAYSYGYLGNAYQRLKDYNQAVKYLEDSYRLKTQMEDSSGMAIDLTNIASIYLEQGDNPSAAKNFRASLNMALTIEYHHLAEHNFQQLAELYESEAILDSALHYQKMFNSFREERVTESTNAKLAELEVQFETEQKEKELALKQAELSSEQLKVRQRNWIVSVLSGLFFFGGFITVLIMRQQKMKQENIERENELKLQLTQVEMENKIHAERERISRDLHDNVGSQISNLITGIEIGNLHLKKEQKDKAVQILSTLDIDARNAMTDLRETIWLLDKDEIAFEVFHSHIKDYLQKQNHYAKGLKTEIISTIETPFILNPTQSLNLMRIIQEAFNNTKKHSSASCFQLHFALSNNGFKVIIKDNGMGIATEPKSHTGYGLKNMKQRAKNMGADFSINSIPNKETQISIFIPDIP